MVVGNYDIVVQHKKSRFPIENKFGESIMMKIEYVSFELTHLISNDVTIFKRHWHQGTWKWSDSRIIGSQFSEHIISEIARMLFAGRQNLASMFLADYLNGICPIA